VKALVLAIDTEKRQLRLSMKQLVPTGLDEFLQEHKPGDTVTGRITDVSGKVAKVELGEGTVAVCRIPAEAPAKEESQASAKADLSSLSSMLQAQWKGDTPKTKSKAEVYVGQIRSFRISALDVPSKKIELELA